MVDTEITCSVKSLPAEWVPLANERAHELCPYRYASPANTPTALRLAVDTARWWGDKPQVITVAFQSGTKTATRNKVLEHANAWSRFCNKSFAYSKTDPMVRVAFGGGGYWSYLGTDLLGIPANEQTMNLQGFDGQMPESEWSRVVRHEFGHTLGFPHEHSREEIITLLDYNKTIDYFRKTQGWSKQDVIDQVLTPLSKKSIRGTPKADDNSIMCYSFPGSITKSGKPIPGGDDINELDAQFIGSLYPKAVDPVIVEGVRFLAELPTGLAPGSYEVTFTPRK